MLPALAVSVCVCVCAWCVRVGESVKTRLDSAAVYSFSARAAGASGRLALTIFLD